MASRLGPVIAAVLSIGALGGAVYAQTSATKPPKKVAVILPPLSCDVPPQPSAPADPTNTAPLVPTLSNQAILCDFTDGALKSQELLDPVATAALIAELNAGNSNSAGASGAPATCVEMMGQGPVYLTFRYGLRPDVSVKIQYTRCGLFASNGVAGGVVKVAEITPKVSATTAPATAS